MTLRGSHPGLRGLALLLRLLEPLGLLVAGLLAYVLRHGMLPDTGPLLALFLLVLAGYVGFAGVMGAYRPGHLPRLWVSVPRVLSAAVLTFGVVVVVLFLFKISSGFSRVWMVMWLALFMGGLTTLRVLAAWLIHHQFKIGKWRRNVAILGTGPKALELIRELTAEDRLEYRLQGLYALQPRSVSADLQRTNLFAGDLDALMVAGMAGDFEDLVIVEDLDQTPDADVLLNKLHQLDVNVLYCLPLPFFGRLSGLNTFGWVGGVPLVMVFRKPLEGHAMLLKRLLDVAVSGFALLLAAPVMLGVALLVKLTSPGPVFFRQKRGGFNGQEFEMLKFRSMRVGEAPKDKDGKEMQAQKTDPRITWVGRIIRKTSLDELPQLLNVLRGDMSLVGPRPHVPSHNSYYEHLIDQYASRHKMRPGLTGWAQLNGWRGETETLDKMAKRVEYDIWYIENWSLWLDVRIILLTPVMMLFQKKAY